MGPEPRRWNRQLRLDALLALVALALSLSTLMGIDSRTTIELGAAWLLAVAHSAPVAGRRIAPRAAFAVSAVAGLAYVALGLPMVGLGVTALLMVYSVGAEIPRRESIIALVAVELGLVAAVSIADTGMQIDTMVGNGLVLAAAWFLGDAARRRRELAAEERAREGRRAAAGERLRIARELHDIVAHSMSVVTVQAGMARMVIDEDPERAKRSLVAIETAGHQAMNELRRLLQVLRTEGAGAPALGPTPQLSDVAVLVTQTVDAGTPVQLRVEGQARAVQPGVEQAAYRVVQEALTNVRKHAPGAAASVAVTYRDDRLVVQVENPLREGTPASDGGHGLAGMRERVELYRGELTAGTDGNGTYRVVASFPYGTEPE